MESLGGLMLVAGVVAWGQMRAVIGVSIALWLEAAGERL